jgi:hypothetical protein
MRRHSVTVSVKRYTGTQVERPETVKGEPKLRWACKGVLKRPTLRREVAKRNPGGYILIADRISVSEHRRVLYRIARPLAPFRWEGE